MRRYTLHCSLSSVDRLTTLSLATVVVCEQLSSRLYTVGRTRGIAAACICATCLPEKFPAFLLLFACLIPPCDFLFIFSSSILALFLSDCCGDWASLAFLILFSPANGVTATGWYCRRPSLKNGCPLLLLLLTSSALPRHNTMLPGKYVQSVSHVALPYSTDMRTDNSGSYSVTAWRSSGETSGRQTLLGALRACSCCAGALPSVPWRRVMLCVDCL